MAEPRAAGYNGPPFDGMRMVGRERLSEGSAARATLLAAAVLGWPSVAWASFNGRLDFPFGLVVVFGVIGALPGGAAILVSEWQLANRTLPPWLGWAAALAAVYSILRVTGIVGRAEDGLIFLLATPPLIELVLITLVPSPPARHAAGWAVAVAIVSLFGIGLALAAPTGSASKGDAWAVLCGGALTTALLWRIGFSLGQRSPRGATIDAPPTR